MENINEQKNPALESILSFAGTTLSHIVKVVNKDKVNTTSYWVDNKGGPDFLNNLNPNMSVAGTTESHIVMVKY